MNEVIQWTHRKHSECIEHILRPRSDEQLVEYLRDGIFMKRCQIEIDSISIFLTEMVPIERAEWKMKINMGREAGLNSLKIAIDSK